MGSRIGTAMVTLLLALGAASLGCKNDEEKFCETMRKFESSYSEGECKKDIENIKKECKNAGEVISCIAGASSEDGVRDCERNCQEN